MPVTLATLRTRVRRRADMEQSNFAADAEINDHINQSYAELYDLLVQAHEDWFLTATTTTVVAGASQINDSPFTSGITKLRLVEKLDGTVYRRVPRTTLQARNDATELSYFFAGGAIYLVPADDAPGTYRVWTVPGPSLMSGDAEFISGSIPLGWDEYIVVDAAIKVLRKEESDVSVLIAEKEAIRRRIERAAATRDSAESARVRDVEGDYWLTVFPRLPAP